MFTSIPIINNPAEASHDEIQALIHTGFCYVKLPGERNAEKLIAALKTTRKESIAFFRKPETEKNKFPNDFSNLIFYSDRRKDDKPQNFQQCVFRPSSPPPQFLHIDKELNAIKKAFTDSIAMPLLRAIKETVCKSSQEKQYFEENLDAPFVSVGFSYYDPHQDKSKEKEQKTSAKSDKNIAFKKHKDTGLFTILDIAEPGLQIWGDGCWIDAEPKEGYVVANLANALELITGKTASSIHQVVMRNTVRESIGIFVEPNRHRPIIAIDGTELYPSGDNYIKQTIKQFFKHKDFTKDATGPIQQHHQQQDLTAAGAQHPTCSNTANFWNTSFNKTPQIEQKNTTETTQNKIK